jgi:hypothetical protein
VNADDAGPPSTMGGILSGRSPLRLGIETRRTGVLGELASRRRELGTVLTDSLRPIDIVRARTSQFGFRHLTYATSCCTSSLQTVSDTLANTRSSQLTFRLLRHHGQRFSARPCGAIPRAWRPCVHLSHPA